MKRIGILGGSFNPVHKDHISLGKFVRESLNLDEIMLIPNANPPHKNTCKVTYQDRVNMLKLALEKEEGFCISNIEEDASIPHYSFDTLKKLNEENPNNAYFFIMGLDSLLYLDKWHLGLHLTDYANLVVMCRKGYESEKINDVLVNFLKSHAVYDSNKDEFNKALNYKCGRCFMISQMLNAISSSNIRDDIKNFYTNHKDTYLTREKALLPDGVLNYILTNHLYA